MIFFDKAGKETRRVKIDGIPVSLDLISSGRILLCFDKRAALLDSKGRTVLNLDSFSDDSRLTAAVVSGNLIYVADAGKRVLFQYSMDGKKIMDIGGRHPATGAEGFIIPSAAFDVIPVGEGTVWAVNSGRHQLDHYGADGRLISAWNAPAVGIGGFSGCCNPVRIALLPNGDFVTAEKHIVRVKVYSPAGRFKCVVASPSQFEKNAQILDVATDSDGKIYVIDSVTGAVRVFARKGTPGFR